MENPQITETIENLNVRRLYKEKRHGSIVFSSLNDN